LEYQSSMYSIEAAYVGLARFYQTNWWSSLWFPDWYGGLPTPSTYPPLLHVLVAATAGLTQLSPAHAYHLVTGILYALVPGAAFLLARLLSGHLGASVTAGVLVSLISPSAVLIAGVANDLGGWHYARRFQCLYTFGEGPHISSILWMLLTLCALHWALEDRRGRTFVLTALLASATILTNTIGAAVLSFAAVAYLGSREDWFRKGIWVHAGIIGLLTALLIAPQLPPSTIQAVRQNAPFVEGLFRPTVLGNVLLVLHIVLGILAAHGLRRLGANILLRFSAAALVPVAGITVSEYLYHTPFLPQPERYHLEMEIFLILLVCGLIAQASFWIVSRRLSYERWIAVSAVVALLVLSVLQVRSTRFFVRSLVKAGVIEETIEYQTAIWLKENLPGQRVYVSGSIAFWLSAFVDQPQIAGGYDNGVPNPNFLAINYQIASGEGSGEREGQVALLWLKALGARAVQTVYPGSTEVFHTFRNPAKFEGLLEEIWGRGDTKVFRVPLRHEGLAFAVPQSALPTRAPIHGMDVEPVEPYVAAIDDAGLPVTKWQQVHGGEADIETTLAIGQVLSVQTSYHPGWQAFVGDREIRVERDSLGQIVLRPGPGKHQIRLVFTGGMERTLLRIAFALGCLLAGWLIWTDWKSQRRPSLSPAAFRGAE